MDKPICRLCGQKHYSNAAHLFREISLKEKAQAVLERNQYSTSEKPPQLSTKAEVAVVPEVVFNALPEVSKNVVLLSNPEVKGPVKRWNRDSWNAYMKDYMKKRRAEKKHLSSNTMAKGSRAYKEDT